MTPPRLLSEEELVRALRELGYTVRVVAPEGFAHYEHPGMPAGYLVFDFSKGPIPLALVSATLAAAGLNLEF